MHIAVAGGGMYGAASALALAEAGHEVELFERATLGSGAAAKAAGIVSTMGWNDDDARLVAETRGRVGELVSLALAAGVREARNAWRPAASLLVASEPGLGALDKVQDRLERISEEPERLDHREAARRFPALRFTPGEEVLVAQEDGVIETGDLFVALRQRFQDEGVAVHENSGLVSLAMQDSRCTGVKAKGATHRADAVVAAAGAWTANLLAEAGFRLPLLNYRVQLSSLALPEPAEVPILHDLVLGFYTRPESAGSFLAGDGTELRPFPPEAYNEAADPSFIELVAERVTQRFTRGEDVRLRASWAGLNVATPDRRPLCGPVEGADGLFVLAGDNGMGIMRGMALGARLAQAVDGRVHPETDPRRYRPGTMTDFPLREGYSDLGT